MTAPSATILIVDDELRSRKLLEALGSTGASTPLAERPLTLRQDDGGISMNTN